MRAVVGSSYTHSLTAERKGTHTYTITTPIPPSPLLATPQTSVLQTSTSTFDSSGCGPAPHPHLSWTQELPPPSPCVITQGVARHPAALADHALQQAKEQHGRIVWGHSCQHTRQGGNQSGRQEAQLTAKPAETKGWIKNLGLGMPIPYLPT